MVRTKETSMKSVDVKRIRVTPELRTKPRKCSKKMWNDKSKRIRPYRCTKTKTTLSPFQLNSDQLDKVKKIKS